MPVPICGTDIEKMPDVAFVRAIAKAEGFYTKGTIPYRYHNPGDLKAVKGFRYEGQIGIGKGRHVIFRTDFYGWRALSRQILLIEDGLSKHYTLTMTLEQVAKQYAGNWRQWSFNVARNLQCSPQVTLGELLGVKETHEAPDDSTGVSIPYRVSV
jgi:hypothetical protein